MIEDINFGREISLGLVFGLGFILLNAFFGFAIGIPQFAFSSDTERWAIISGVAPLVEEGVFRGVLPFALAMIGVPFALNLVVNVISFPLFHYFAYGSSIASASSLFIGAGIFALISFLMTYYQSDADELQVPVTSIIGHMMINTWIGIKAAGLVLAGFV